MCEIFENYKVLQKLKNLAFYKKKSLERFYEVKHQEQKLNY